MGSFIVPSSGSDDEFKPKKLNINPAKGSPLQKRTVSTPTWGEEPDLTALGDLNFNSSSDDDVDDKSVSLPKKKKPIVSQKMPFLIVEDDPLSETATTSDYSVIPPKLDSSTVKLPPLEVEKAKAPANVSPSQQVVYHITNMYGNINSGDSVDGRDIDIYLDVMKNPTPTKVTNLLKEYEHRIDVLKAKLLVLKEEERFDI